MSRAQARIGPELVCRVLSSVVAWIALAAPASAQQIQLHYDNREMSLAAPDLLVFPAAPFQRWEEMHTDQGFSVEQTSTFYTDSFIGRGRAVAGEEAPPVGDPSGSSRGSFVFGVASPTSYEIEGRLEIVPSFANPFAPGATVSLYRVEAPSPTPIPVELVVAHGIGSGSFTPTHLDFRDLLVLEPGDYWLIISATVGDVDVQAAWDVRAAVVPHPQKMPGVHPVLLTLALLLTGWCLQVRSPARTA